MIAALEGGEWSAVRPGRILPPGKKRYPFYMSLGGPQGRSGHVRKISPTPGFDPQTLQPVTSRYTDWAIPVHIVIIICIWLCLSDNKYFEAAKVKVLFCLMHPPISEKKIITYSSLRIWNMQLFVKSGAAYGTGRPGMEHRWIGDYKGKPKYSKKNLSRVFFFPQPGIESRSP